MSHELWVTIFRIMDALGIKIEPTAGDATNSGVEQVILNFKSLEVTVWSSSQTTWKSKQILKRKISVWNWAVKAICP